MVRHRRRPWVGLGVAAVAAAVTGCAVLPTPQPAQPQEPQLPPYLAGLHLSEDTTPATAVAADRLLQLDPCALLDPVVAEQTLGQQRGVVTPGDEITSCGLDLTDPANSDNRTNLNVKVEPFEDRFKTDTAPVQLPGGVTVYRTDMGSGCIYDHDLGGGFAISVQVSVYGAAEGQPCVGGDRLMAGIAPRLADPPTRDQQVTTPAVTAISPCIAIREAMHTIPPLPGNANNTTDQRPQVSYTEPHKCSVEDWMFKGGSMAHPQQRVQVTMEASDDPEHYVRTGVLQPVTVEGRPGTVRPPDDPNDDEPTCEVAVRIADDVQVRVNPADDDGEVITRVLRVQALTCDQATQVAAQTLRAVRT